MLVFLRIKFRFLLFTLLISYFHPPLLPITMSYVSFMLNQWKSFVKEKECCPRTVFLGALSSSSVGKKKKIKHSTGSTTRRLHVSFQLSHKMLAYTESKTQEYTTLIPDLSHFSFFIVQVNHLTLTSLNLDMC